MKKLCLFLSFMIGLMANAQTVDQTFYVDFGENNVASRGNLTTGADANGNHWTNVYSSPSERCYPKDWQLVNNNNEASEYILQLGTYFHTNGMSGGGGLQSPSASLLGDLAVATATQDYIHVESFQDYNVINFRNLDKTKAYRFHCFGSRVVAEERGGTFEFRGENKWSDYMQMSGSGIGSGGYNGNNNKIMVSEPIFPDKDGIIAMTFIKKFKNGMIYLNCMKIEELSGLERPNSNLTMTQKLLVDFGETDNSSRGHQTVGADKNGNYWNNLSSGKASSNQIPQGTTVALVNAENESTGYAMETLSLLETNGVDAGGLNNPNSDWLGDLAVQTATEDYIWIYDNSTRSISFSGLDPQKCYKFYIFGSRATSESDRRISDYQLAGQSDWSTSVATSGTNVGGQGIHGNNRNIAVSDYIFPDATGKIVFSCKKNTGITTSHAHFNAIKIEEYSGAERPADPIVLASAKISGTATETGADVVMNEIKTGVFECYQKLQNGAYNIKGVTRDGRELELGTDAGGRIVENGTAFQVNESQVVRLRLDTKKESLEVLPVQMYVKGNIAKNGTTIEYAGNGIFSQEVKLDDSGVFLFSDKYIYFSLNDDDNLALKRLNGTRTQIAMPSDGFAAENIRINGGTYTMTLDMNNYTWAVDAPIDGYKISAFGSSVCNGQGADGFKGYAYLYGNQLGTRYNRGTSEYPFTVSGVSIGGNTTQNLLDRYDEMIHDFGKYVIIGLSMGNEGIHGASNQQAVFNQFRDNMLKLISQMKADGKTVVVMNNYTRADYNTSDYNYVKRMNLLIHEWDVASVNTLGAIDNGAGKWADGYKQDDYHPTGTGHQQFMKAIPASLFDALEQGKPQPVRDMTQSMKLENGSVIQFKGETDVNPYAVSVRIRGTEAGKVISFTTRAGKEASVSILDDGRIQYTSYQGESFTSANSLVVDADKWYDITLTNYFAQKRTLVYCNRTLVGELSERIVPDQFIIGDSSKALHREFAELSFWRSALNSNEVGAIVSGSMLKSSLDIYSPLSDEIKDGQVENLAQSLNEAQYVEGSITDGISAVGSSADGEKIYFSANGMRLSSPQKGLNIVQTKNGAVKQILK